MAFSSVMAPDPSDSLAFAGVHLLHDRKLQKEKLFCSLGLLGILPFSSSFARRDRRRQGKHRSRKYNENKRALQFLKPGALAQLRDAARTAARSMPAADFHASNACDQVDMHPDSERGEIGELQGRQAQTAAMLTSSMLPVAKMLRASKVWGPSCPQRKKLLAPRTPLSVPVAAPATAPTSTPAPATDLEALPLELLVRIVCSLHHDQLKPAFHVSKRLRQAVLIARQCHFDFTTPDRERRDGLRLHMHGERVKIAVSRVHAATPMAPRQAQKPLHAQVFSLVQQQRLARLLLNSHESRLRHTKPPSSLRPASRGITSHRALFYEEQLCQSAFQN